MYASKEKKNLPSSSSEKATILIVEDDPSAREILTSCLEDQFTIYEVPSSEEALTILETVYINIMLLDIILPGMDGINLLEEITDRHPDMNVVVITALQDAELAAKLMKYGVHDFITKDFDPDEIVHILEKLICKQKEDWEVMYLRSEMKQYTGNNTIQSKSKKMCIIDDIVQKVASLPATIFIQGESGTGKEVIARRIHELSDKRDAPFVAVNIASVPETLMESFLFGHEKGAFTGALKQHFGKFELANNGILFLDEIGDLKYDLQVKLLRVLQEGEFERVGGTQLIKVTVRLIVATNKNLARMVENGAFREDLYYRINVVPLYLPPLKERKEDIPLLIEHFIDKYNKKFTKQLRGITQSALKAIEKYSWPGNIRELENFIERLVAILDKSVISQSDIPIEYQLDEIETPKIFDMNDSEIYSLCEDYLTKACETFERNYILKVMEKVGWNRKDAAEKLGIPLSTLKYKLTKKKIYKILREKGR